MDEASLTVHASCVEIELLRIPKEFVDVEPVRHEHVGCIAENMLAVFDSTTRNVMARTTISARKCKWSTDILSKLIQELEQTRIHVLRGFHSAIAVALFRAMAHEFFIGKIL